MNNSFYYTDENTTPFLWHKFNRYFRIPCSFLSAMVSYYQQGSILISDILILIAAIVFEINAGSKNKTALYSIYLIDIIHIVTGVLMVMVTGTGYGMGPIISGICELVYYRRRKNFFVSETKETDNQPIDQRIQATNVKAEADAKEMNRFSSRMTEDTKDNPYLVLSQFNERIFPNDCRDYVKEQMRSIVGKSVSDKQLIEIYIYCMTQYLVNGSSMDYIEKMLPVAHPEIKSSKIVKQIADYTFSCSIGDPSKIDIKKEYDLKSMMKMYRTPVSEIEIEKSSIENTIREKEIDTTIEETDSYKRYNGTNSSKGKVLYCRKCGAKLDENSLFCNKCGTSVNKGENK